MFIGTNIVIIGSENTSEATITSTAIHRRHSRAIASATRLTINMGMNASAMKGAGKKDRGLTLPA